MTFQREDKKQALCIISLIIFSLLILIVFRKEILICYGLVLNSIIPVHDLMWKTMNVFVMIVYIGCFGILGYRKAVRKKLNGVFWGIVCAVLGVWGYLYLLCYKSKSETSSPNP